MTDMLETASNWLEDMRDTHATTGVEYCRGGDSAQVSATVGRTIFRINDAYGGDVRHVSRDYLILAADLVLAGLRTLPERGDQITEAVGDKVYVYEVMSPGGNEPDWRYCDAYRKTLRIHTKHVATEAA